MNFGVEHDKKNPKRRKVYFFIFVNVCRLINPLVLSKGCNDKVSTPLKQRIATKSREQPGHLTTPDMARSNT